MRATAKKNFNVGLSRFHNGFFIGYCLFYLGVLLIGLFGEESYGRGTWTWTSSLVLLLLIIFFAAFPIVHYFAAKGARAGRTYGRTCTRFIASVWLIGFPVGTALAIYAFYKTSDSEWQSATDDNPLTPIEVASANSTSPDAP